MSEPGPATFDGFVHAHGGSLHDGQHRPRQLRGVGLGGWLLPEGYMWRFPREAPQSPRRLEALVDDLLGADAAASFWRRYRDHFMAETDIERIAGEGFDHVRLPLNGRHLIDDAGDLQPEGLEPVDRLVEWCRRHRLWVILDLHAAPGGQTGTNIDDSPRGLPDLFLVGGAYRERTIALWTQLAARYRDETVVAGYDLLNEPLPHQYGERFGSELAGLYRELAEAIRAVDPNHLLIFEGTRWSTDWSIFSEAWDANSMLQFHKYWSAPDRPSIAGFVRKGEELSLPIYMGEGGENDLAWIQTAFGLYEDLGIAWNFWTWKKLATWTSPASVVPPAGWADVVDYAAGRRAHLPVGQAQRTFETLLERVRLEACEARPAVTCALFHRVPVRLAAESFGFGGVDASYRTGGARPLGWFRSDDHVTIRSLEGGGADAAFGPVDAPDTGRASFEVVLGAGDWVRYTVDVPAPTRLVVEVEADARSGSGPCAPVVDIDGDELTVTSSGGRSRWITAGPIPSGRHRVRVAGSCPDTALRSLSVRPEDGPDPA